MRQFFDILAKNLDNFLHLLHTIDLWYLDGSLDESQCFDFIEHINVVVTVLKV